MAIPRVFFKSKKIPAGGDFFLFAKGIVRTATRGTRKPPFFKNHRHKDLPYDRRIIHHEDIQDVGTAWSSGSESFSEVLMLIRAHVFFLFMKTRAGIGDTVPSIYSVTTELSRRCRMQSAPPRAMGPFG